MKLEIAYSLSEMEAGSTPVSTSIVSSHPTHILCVVSVYGPHIRQPLLVEFSRGIYEAQQGNKNVNFPLQMSFQVLHLLKVQDMKP